MSGWGRSLALALVGLLLGLDTGCSTGALGQTIAGPAGLEYQVAAGSAWKGHEDYLKRLRDAVRTEWEKIYVTARLYPTAGEVVVRCRVGRDGRIERILDADGTSNSYGKKLCKWALKKLPAPEPWTPEMARALGAAQDVTFLFYYRT